MAVDPYGSESPDFIVGDDWTIAAAVVVADDAAFELADVVAVQLDDATAVLVPLA